MAAQPPSSGAKETADAKQRERSQDSLIDKDFLLFLRIGAARLKLGAEV